MAAGNSADAGEKKFEYFGRERLGEEGTLQLPP